MVASRKYTRKATHKGDKVYHINGKYVKKGRRPYSSYKRRGKSRKSRTYKKGTRSSRTGLIDFWRRFKGGRHYGKRGSKSKTHSGKNYETRKGSRRVKSRPGHKGFMTHKGSKYYNEGNHWQSGTPY